MDKLLPMTAAQMIEKLKQCPQDTVPIMHVHVEITTEISTPTAKELNRVEKTTSSTFVKGKVYGINWVTGGENKIDISGS